MTSSSSSNQTASSILHDDDISKGTPDMLQSLQKMRDALACPLCDHVVSQPSTLACGHSFCRSCIEQYSCNHWECPVPTCRLPITSKSQGSSYRKINPALDTVATSWSNICAALEHAPKDWWKGGGEIQRNVTDVSMVHNAYDDDDDSSLNHGNGEMVDLQAIPHDTQTSLDDTFATAESGSIND